ncbi:PAS-domain containing protein, partial [Bradyrhizobium campsiandrae]|uniref:PAS-domain containing protein n=1 Tax=Bradyrhizobium campsiandrae TaxID=1729892 RepID=UPI00289E3B64
MSAALNDSLFEVPGPLFAGIVFVAIGAAITALRTGQILTWSTVGLIILAGALRLFDLFRFLPRKANLTDEEAVLWQRRYLVGALIQAAAIGTWCSLALVSTDDAVVHMIALSITTGIVGGGAGRAYGRPSIYHLQAGLMFGPAVIALASHGTPYYIAMSFVSAAFLLAIMQISANLHRIFMRAVVAGEREAALAGQFDTALNNMPHGLCMFRLDRQLAVMNHRFSAMLSLPDELIRSGISARDVLSACVSSGSISAASAETIIAAIESAQAREIVTADPDAERNRSLSWTVQPMADGGAVVLLEDVTERRNA